MERSVKKHGDQEPVVNLIIIKLLQKKEKKLTYKQSRFTTWTALTFLYLDIYQGSKIFCEFIFYGRNSKEFDKFVSALISLDAHYSAGVY